MTDKIEVLPGTKGPGFVRLVDHMGDDLSIVRAARVSYDADWRAGDDEGSDTKLIRYLLNHHHTSPFEHVTFTFEVKAPIFVFRQWHRHRTWSYSEMSARYAELDEGFYLPDANMIGTQSKDNKQVRNIETGVLDPGADAMRQTMSRVCEDAFLTYRTLLAEGCPRELARSVLPLSTYSRMFATIDLHNLLGFFTLRDHAHAQWEVQVYARAMRQLILPIVPTTIEAYNLVKMKGNV